MHLSRVINTTHFSNINIYMYNVNVCTDGTVTTPTW